MNSETFSEIYDEMSMCYGRKSNDAMKRRFWHKFASTPAETFQKAADAYMDAERYFPTIEQLAGYVRKYAPIRDVRGQAFANEPELTIKDLEFRNMVHPTFMAWCAGEATYHELEVAMLRAAQRLDLPAVVREISKQGARS